MSRARPSSPGSRLALWLALCACAGCGRDIGTVDLSFRTSPDSDEDPFASAAKLRVAIDIGDFDSWEQELTYTPDAVVSFPEIPAGDPWVISVELFSDDEMANLWARGQSLPFMVPDGGASVELYVAKVGRFSEPSPSEYQGTPRGGHTAVTLADGKVLLLGGAARLDFAELSVDSPLPVDAAVGEVELFDPTSGRIERGGDCPDSGETDVPLCIAGRLGAAISRTSGGDVLVAGGGPDDRSWLPSVDRLPRGETTFRGSAPLLPSQRRGATLVEIPGGALLIGGRDQTGTVLATAALFGERGDFVRELVVAGDCPRVHATAAVAGGVVLLFGGEHGGALRADYAVIPLAPSVAAGACHELAATGIEPRIGAVATVIDDRFVMISGGLLDDGETPTPSEEVDVFDAETGVLCRAGSLSRPRHLHAAAVLPDGRVLVLGGTPAAEGSISSFNTYEIVDASDVIGAMLEQGEGYDCGSRQVSTPTRGSLAAGRAAATATTLANGMVVIAGGFDEEGLALHQTGRLPVLLFVP